MSPIKFLRSKPLILIILLVGLILAVILSATVLIKSEGAGELKSTTAQYPAGNPGENSSFVIWSKVVKTSNGISLLKSDSYNVMVLSVYPRTYWNPIYQRWSIPVAIAGLGVTKPGYSLVRAAGLKTITLDSDQELDVYPSFTLNLHGKLDYYSMMLSIATDGVGDVMWPSFTPDLISSSGDHTVMHSGDARTDKEAGRFYTTLEKWEYSDTSGDDEADAIYALDIRTECYPGQVEDLCYVLKYSWSLADTSKNEMHLRVSLPPNPESMTPQELERYGITRYTYLNSGRETYGYYIDNFQYEVS